MLVSYRPAGLCTNQHPSIVARSSKSGGIGLLFDGFLVKGGCAGAMRKKLRANATDRMSLAIHLFEYFVVGPRPPLPILVLNLPTLIVFSKDFVRLPNYKRPHAIPVWLRVVGRDLPKCGPMPLQAIRRTAHHPS